MRERRPEAPPRGARLIAVPCCVCDRPTRMRVPAALLAELRILHLCGACSRAFPAPAAGAHADRGA